METSVEIEFLDIRKNQKYIELINNVVNTCFIEENLQNSSMYLNIILTNPKNIKSINKQYRNIDKETDVLSFPMFEKAEVQEIINNKKTFNVSEVFGDIIISIERVEKQAKEYGHSFERELAYMVVHGFYHIMGYDHIKDEEKQEMRKKEESILKKLELTRS